MRRPTSLLLGALLALGLVGCATPSSERPLVVVTTNILGDVVTNLVGDEADVLTLMKPDADPHSFEISAREAARLRAADLVVSNGLGLEEGLEQHVASADAAGVPGFVAGEHIEVLDYAEGDSAGMPDSHFWTDPARMLDVVDALVPELSALEGVDPDAIAASSNEYRAELETLDAEMTTAFDAITPERRALVTNHHVFGYLADRFDFRVLGAAIPGGTTLAAPSASDLRDLVAAIDEAQVATIFAESSQPDRLVQVLADEADRHVVVVALFTESLTAEGGGAETYLTMMRVNTERIASGLA
jgi:zinc/manganese transport system substrate-binding protein